MKIVINRCYGGIGFSKELFEKLGIPWDNYGYLDNTSFNIEDSNPEQWRTHPSLIETIEILGEKANNAYSKLEIVEVPDGISWYISKYDGMESVHAKHMSWP